MTSAQDLSNYEFVPIIEAGEIQAGDRLVIEVDGIAIAVFNVSGQYFAVGDVCTHDDGPLAEGELDGFQLICPRHGARFDIRTGKALTLPAVAATTWYPVRVTGGMLEVGLPVE